jgi:hypothetical protein
MHPIIPALGEVRLRQEDHEFEANLYYIVRPVSKKKKRGGVALVVA